MGIATAEGAPMAEDDDPPVQPSVCNGATSMKYRSWRAGDSRSLSSASVGSPVCVLRAPTSPRSSR